MPTFLFEPVLVSNLALHRHVDVVLVAHNLYPHAALLDGAVITQTTRFFATLSSSPLTQASARISTLVFTFFSKTVELQPVLSLDLAERPSQPVVLKLLDAQGQSPLSRADLASERNLLLHILVVDARN